MEVTQTPVDPKTLRDKYGRVTAASLKAGDHKSKNVGDTYMSIQWDARAGQTVVIVGEQSFPYESVKKAREHYARAGREALAKAHA